MLFQSYLDGPVLPIEGAQVPEVIRMCLLRRTPCSILRCHAGRQLKARYPGGDSAVCVDRGLLIRRIEHILGDGLEVLRG